MEAQSYTAEERRAANQVWAAAGAYGFEPLFLARNTDGTIDFYMNCIVGRKTSWSTPCRLHAGGPCRAGRRPS